MRNGLEAMCISQKCQTLREHNRLESESRTYHAIVTLTGIGDPAAVVEGVAPNVVVIFYAHRTGPIASLGMHLRTATVLHLGLEIAIAVDHIR